MRVINKSKSYPGSFRKNAVALVRRSERPMNRIAKSLGVHPSTLRYWYDVDVPKKTKKGTEPPKLPVGDPAAQSAAETIAELRKEVATLRKENESLKDDREILKKAA
jgi:transposase